VKTSVLVTGATGFLGEHLCRVLVAEGHIVRGLARSRSAVLEDLGVEHVRGDVLSNDDLQRALDGVSAVFHLAGAVSRDPGDAQRMMRLHVDGTRKVMEQMAAFGIRRMILASTSGTIGVSKDETIRDETAPYAEEIVAGWPYYASKIYQERLAFEHGERLGIEVVAVNPSLLLGPGDRRLSSTGDVRKFIKRQLPTVPEGGINFVDARDAAQATAAALSKGRAGERYLLGGPNWTMKEFFDRLGRVASRNLTAFARPRSSRRVFGRGQRAHTVPTAIAARSARQALGGPRDPVESYGSRGASGVVLQRGDVPNLHGRLRGQLLSAGR
jgi:dihydroflavonol-4-reductase